MRDSAESPKLSILHVLTLNGRNGEYGGPVRVARELCTELNSRGHSTHIFSGAREGSEPIPRPGLAESFILVKPISRRLAVSSLWSWKLIKPLNKLITNADVVHIHFARDLIPFLTAFIAILKRKPFVTQTHGMIINDGRISSKFIDFLMTRPLINRSHTNFVLTHTEQLAILRLKIKSHSVILPNGIALRNINDAKRSKKKIIFCSRLEARKDVTKFVELADRFRMSDFLFEVYGPDGGELTKLKEEIYLRKLETVVKYYGPLLADQVQHVLSKSDLLVLPSKDEPFPMIVLEALAVGTPVLVMPSCGLSEELRKFNFNFVAKSESIEGLIDSFQSQAQNNFNLNSHFEIRQYCKNRFSITEVAETCLKVYINVLKTD